MTQYLPPNLLALFAPRESLPYLPPLDTLPWDRKPWPYNGVSECLRLFEDPSETPPATRGETKDERIARKRQAREERHRSTLEEKVNEWEPNKDPNAEGDPFRTLFVGRINFDTSESKLRREFEQYGPIKKISIVMNKITGKPRGYAFIIYERERDMHSAYKHADGKKIDGKRVVVDVERGRTVKTWKPRRLGGGLGGTRRGAPQENIKYSGRVDERDMNHGERESHRDRTRERNADRDRERDRERDQERRRERSREREKERGRRSRSRDRERRDRGVKERGDRERDNSRRDRSRSRDRNDRREKDKDKGKDNHRERDRDKDKERSKDRSSRRDKERGRDKDREKSSRDKDREREKEREKGKRESKAEAEDGEVESSRDREREKERSSKKSEHLEDGEMREETMDDSRYDGEQMEA